MLNYKTYQWTLLREGSHFLYDGAEIGCIENYQQNEPSKYQDKYLLQFQEQVSQNIFQDEIHVQKPKEVGFKIKKSK